MITRRHCTARGEARVALRFTLLAAALAVPPPLLCAEEASPLPPAVTVKKDLTIKVEVSGKKAGEIVLRQGEMLDVVEASRTGFIVRKGGFDPFELRRYQLERVKNFEALPGASPGTGSAKPNPRAAGPALDTVKDFGVMVEDAWSDKGAKRSMFAWPGREVVLFTSTDQLDPEVMRRMMDQLDRGWRFYKEVTGLSPSHSELSRKFHGRGIIIAVPDISFIGNNAALGYLGGIGIEVALFYDNPFGEPGDYEKFKETGVLSEYYFYEMGRNYYLFGESHGLFATGFAIAMSILCLDSISSQIDVPPHPRRPAARAVEKSFYASSLSWPSSFAELGAAEGISLLDSDGRPLPSGLGDLYASMVLYLFDHHGGRPWLESYYRHLSQAPPSPQKNAQGAEGQILTMALAASLAAEENLTGLFRDRWRAPLPAEIGNYLERIDWKNNTMESCLAAIPPEVLPLALAANHPDFAREAKNSANLLDDPSFEGTGSRAWKNLSTGTPAGSSDLERQKSKDGNKSVAVNGEASSSTGWKQEVRPVAGKTYLLSGWIKTENLVPTRNSNGQGAFLTVGNAARTLIRKGTTDWHHVGVPVRFENNDSIQVELVVRDSIGRAWFDDVRLSELPEVQ